MSRTSNLLGPLALVASLTAAPPPKSVFILHSYRPGFEWTDHQNRSIHERLEDAPFAIRTQVDFLDVIREPAAFAAFRARYNALYAGKPFDLVIATDDDAARFLAENPALFPNIPVVFGGVSDRVLIQSLPRERFTGVIEIFNEYAMLDLALRIHANTRNVVVIADGTPVSNYFVDSLTRRAANAPWHLQVLTTEKQPLDEILQDVAARQPGDIILLANLFRDHDGSYLPRIVSHRLLAEASPVPVYGLASQVGSGLIAGSAGTGLEHGRRIGSVALRVLEGTQPAAIPLSEDDENILQFDARQMARFGVSNFPLPANAQLLFNQENAIERYQAWILLAAALALLQMFIIGGLIVNVLNRRRAERALSEQNQKLEAAAEAKKRFVANMSHELRTPMNAILGMSGLLLDTPLSTQQREFAETVRNSAHSLLGILNDVLELSRIEGRQIRIEHAPFDPRLLLDDLARSLHTVVPAGVALHVEVDGAVPPFLVSDPNRVRQVLLNFLFNAVKFTSNGRIDVHLRTDGPGHYRFAVTDTGIGIPAEKLDLVFDRFYQVDDSSARQFGGSGLGLAICREITNALHGEIGVDSAVGKGSTFWFRIPAESLTELPPSTTEVPLPPHGLRILVVEDNAINLRLAGLLLEKLGCIVETASGGAAALAAVEQSSFDLILMDVQMPDMDGLEVTRRIRTLEGSRKHTPIVALTAGVSQEDRSQCFEAGMDAHLPKPISREDLASVLFRFAAQNSSAK